MKTKSSAYTIGIDLDDRKHAICLLDAKGNIVKQESITNSRRVSPPVPQGSGGIARKNY